MRLVRSCTYTLYPSLIRTLRAFEHFASEGHCSFLENVTITFMDKNDPKDSNRWEHCWRHTLKTTAPLGLNVEGD